MAPTLHPYPYPKLGMQEGGIIFCSSTMSPDIMTMLFRPPSAHSLQGSLPHVCMFSDDLAANANHQLSQGSQDGPQMRVVPPTPLFDGKGKGSRRNSEPPALPPSHNTSDTDDIGKGKQKEQGTSSRSPVFSDNTNRTSDTVSSSSVGASISPSSGSFSKDAHSQLELLYPQDRAPHCSDIQNDWSQTYGSCENIFSAANRQIKTLIENKSIQYNFAYIFMVCGGRPNNDSNLGFMRATPLALGFIEETSRAQTPDDLISRMRAHVQLGGNKRTHSILQGLRQKWSDFKAPARLTPPHITKVQNCHLKLRASLYNLILHGSATCGDKGLKTEAPSKAASDKSKGVPEGLSVTHLAILKEGILHPETPITFHKVEGTDVEVLRANRLPVIITTISKFAPLRRRIVTADGKTKTVFISPPTSTQPSMSKAAALGGADSSGSESEDTPTAADAKEADAKSRKREGEDSRKRAHSVTMVSSGSQLEAHSAGAATKLTRTSSNPEVDEITPATKTQRKPITARSAITTAKATGAPKAKVVKERASKSTKTTYRPPHVFTAMATQSPSAPAA
ncbi:hypothetical protein FIBSPDRAFT_948417 [Athelia psychrophila]|uniref:Uncharacterized protein n=1 Tax=Athelia psychrophila TaxID=1759441 RepID=A0A166QSA4_9AGAM|nr:hypothetical protein FIBSPDRAFT_948417 [Fibularhizoctonia sp. CBS 109695]